MPIAHASATEIAASADERPRRDRRPQRPPVELVERVRAHTHREREREHRQRQATPRDGRRETAADHDVREMPRRVREMQQGHVVPPPTRLRARRTPVSRAHAPHHETARRATTGATAPRRYPPPATQRRGGRAARAGGSRGSTRRETRRPRASRARSPVPPPAARPARTPPTPVSRPRAAARTRASRSSRRGARPARARAACGRIVDVAQQVRERQVVERSASANGRASAARLDERHLVTEPTACHVEHLRALVEPRDLEAAVAQLAPRRAPSRSPRRAPARRPSGNLVTRNRRQRGS